MKIHKLNLENNYRNLMLDTIQMRCGKNYNRQPTFSEVVIKANKNEPLVIALPSLANSRISTMDSAGMWQATGVHYATASIVGLDPDKSIPLENFSLGLERDRVYCTTEAQEQTMKLYTIPSNVDKLKVVISFKSYYTETRKVNGRMRQVTEYLVSNDSLDAMTIKIDWKDTSFSPVTIMERDIVDLDSLVARVEALEQAADETDPDAGQE